MHEPASTVNVIGKGRARMRASGVFRIPVTLATMVIAVLVMVVGVQSAAAAVTPSPAWSIQSVAGPTNFIPGDESGTETYKLYVTNLGSRSTDGSAVTITDSLPAGVRAAVVSGREYKRFEALSCTTVPAQCTYTGVAPPGDILEMESSLEIEPAASGSVTNTASVAGGGASSVAASVTNMITAELAPFAIDEFSFGVTGVEGTPETQAGAHPYAVTTTLDFKTQQVPTEHVTYVPAENVKDVVVDLPPGFVGDALTAPRCPLYQLEPKESNTYECPGDSKIGEVTLRSGLGSGIQSSVAGLESGAPVSPLFNMAPEPGHPAEFGIAVGEVGDAHLFPSVVRTSDGYSLRVTTPNIQADFLTAGERGFLAGITLTLFGDPAIQDGGGASPAPFFTNPTDCAASGQTVTVHVDTWTQPGRIKSDGTPDFSDPSWLEAKAALPRVTGCEALQFRPTFALVSNVAQADAPAGIMFALAVPQAPNNDAALATPELKDATVELPPGLSLSPSAANGLEACTPSQFDLEDNSIQAACPRTSQVAEVEVTTPVLEKPLHGRIYVAQPTCGGRGQPECTEADAANGDLFGLNMQVGGEEGETTGVIIKLAGKVSVNPSTGQITAAFQENPQLPFSELQIRLTGGPRAPLANPQNCGSFAATTDLVPWSTPTTPDATPSSRPFEISGCSNPMPFAPSFEAGTVVPRAASSSPFVLTISRSDGQQDLAQISTTLPPGLVGMISEVPLCEEAQANAGSCPESSQIGTTTVAAGSGPDPLWVSGKVYLTGPYDGAPFGLSVVVPAKAGPFNLGNVVVRAAINIDPDTSAVTVTSGPIPQIRDGVPFRLKTINVAVNRSGFMLNPTNCEERSINGEIAAAQGARIGVSSPFAVGNCANLPFKPSFTATTQAKTSKANGASLDVKVSYPSSGQTNIKSVKVDLPKQLPSRLTTLQKACAAAVFGSNPAKCPSESIVGIVKAKTPVLPVTLTGPAYLVSHAAEAFPDLVVILQGDGVRVDLMGQTDIKKDVTSSTFASVPDVPVSSFELYLPEGKYSALTANANLCSGKLQMPTKISGQNGAVIKQTTTIRVSGCPKPKKTARKAKKASRAGAHTLR